jgi:hypothetical protein
MNKTPKTPWVRYYKKGDLELKITQTYFGATTNKYQVDKLSGNWGEDDELIQICDGFSKPFDGSVLPSGDNTAYVTVYID